MSYVIKAVLSNPQCPECGQITIPFPIPNDQYGTIEMLQAMELELPATDYEMLDMMARLRLEPGKLPYVEVLKIRGEYDYLGRCIHEQPDIYQLNALARKLLEFTSMQEMAAFEGMVGKELEKGAIPIELPRLIDFAHSTDGCVIAGDAVTDFQLGRFLVENGFLSETENLPEAAVELLDFAKIGGEHREQEGGVYTSFGYVEQSLEIVRASKAMDFGPRKPAYTLLLNMMALPLGSGGQKGETVQLRLPAPEAQAREALEKLGKRDWNDIAVSILDSPIPELNHTMYFNGETPKLLELSRLLSELDARGQMTKYKAILAANDCRERSRMISLASAADAYFFEPKISGPGDVARDELGMILCDKDAETLLPHIDLAGYGRALLARDHARITGYGLVERRDDQPVLEEEQAPVQGGMEMM